MEPIQYLIIIFVLFTSSRVALRFRDKKISLREFLFWELLWAGVLLFGIFPSWFSHISEALGIGRVVDLFLYGGIGLIFYMQYRLYAKINSVEQDVTKITRNIAVERGRRR